MFGGSSVRRMEELGSLKPSRIVEKTKEPYFGTYHHSTSAASKKTRAVVKAMFTNAFASLPFGRDDELGILDLGCGLGFLSCASAEFYKNARILGFSDRIDFKKGDVFRFRPIEKFDIIVSNLVFHNFGKMRFKAYSRLSLWAQAGSFVVMGDLFFSRKTDIAQLLKTFRILKEIRSSKSDFEQYALLMMSKDSRRAIMD